MKDYEIFNAGDTLVIAFRSPALLDLNPIALTPGRLYPGAKVMHLSSDKTGAGFLHLDFKPPVIYRGLFNTYTRDGILACFDRPGMKKLDEWAEWFWAFHWLPEHECFCWSSSKQRRALMIETDNAVFKNRRRRHANR